MTPALGKQERANRTWIREIQAGFVQKNPKYFDEWLFDFIKSEQISDSLLVRLYKIKKIGNI